MQNLDETDHKLLSLLRENARYSIAYLAKKLQVSRGTVSNRLAKLEDEGVIRGYTVELRPENELNRVHAWTSIVIEGNMTLSVVKALRGDPCVSAIYDTNGRWDILVELRANSLEELGKALERIRLIKNISKSETSIHLKNYM
ncbi:Lrp/AsnC family transcriptional regulator [Pelistega sp. NLN82]|uniref:Lrp/AsnC family transcriptional regulator n=1 Tax=Pelistega ratti TaxID=2652177 RepID=A0A6L9Y409_9BURK|nr:Lrp/AsnC family transcriptional regulator [Pelistega ratti]NEN75180.1 Lrp/AsnC family transcriptional regulator [Pelistega ratti]